MLMLTKDKQSIVDEAGNVLFKARPSDSRSGTMVYRQVEAPVERGKGKYCIEFKIEPKKVCVSWDEHKACLEWAGVDVEVCTKYAEAA